MPKTPQRLIACLGVTLALQHLLPAAYVGGFSAAPKSRLRESTVWVARRDKSTAFEQKAENVAARHDFYTLETPATMGDPGREALLFIDQLGQVRSRSSPDSWMS